MTTHLTHLGIIEGFYGKPWGFAKRSAYISFMKQFRYSFYIYAPKTDRFLREDWQETMPEPLFYKLKELGEQFQTAGISWGVGLSPFDTQQDFNKATQIALSKKLTQLESLDIDRLALLFDDMRGDFPDLAQRQIEICDFVRQNSDIKKLMMCPSYYSFDGILEELFGKQPENYLLDIGAGLDSNIDIFWTGEKICSTGYSAEHLKQVGEILQRKPFIWDNYPVNDGAAMSPFLHLTGSRGRECCQDDYIAGLAVNPMNEAFLSQIPLASLTDALVKPAEHNAHESFEKWSDHFLGKASQDLKNDVTIFEKQGLHDITADNKQALIEKYQALSNEKNKSYIDELLEYLSGVYLSDVKDSVPTQVLWED